MNICDLTKGAAFFPERNAAPVPIVAAFGTGAFHQCKRTGKWNFDQATRECEQELIRSFKLVYPNESMKRWEDLIFQFGEKEFLCAEESRIVGYADTAAKAEKITEEFSVRFGVPEEVSSGRFRLIRKDKYDAFACEDVELSGEVSIDPQIFRLCYPDNAWSWHLQLIDSLRKKKSGLSILEGPPGTGKTTYLRYLMREMEATHHFYFVPPSGLSMLSHQDFLAFWSREVQMAKSKRFIMILEDAEAALMSRAEDNRNMVSTLLNLTDGILGDFLSIQVICTVNCKASDLDPALMRPGRLVSHRVFRKLFRNEVAALANHYGSTTPPSGEYTLAEIFSETIAASKVSPRVGFGLS